MVFDLTFIFIAFDNVPRLLTGNDWSVVLLVALAGWRLAGAWALGLYGADFSSLRGAGRWLMAEVLFAAGAIWLNLRLPHGLSLEMAAVGAGGHAALMLVHAIWRRGKQSSPPNDDLVPGLLLFLALVLMHPWFSSRLTGTGDARLYQETLHEFLNQLRAGIWPPWVSQSEIAPFGAVFPFRLATYHYYFAALLDALSGDRLPVYAVQHLTLVLSAVAGGWAMFAVLRGSCLVRPWVAGAFAALYLASPAWLGPLYGFSMFFTYMALPFLPFALAGARPALGAPDLPTALCHGAALAAVWHAHPPVGFWVSAAVATGQITAFGLERPGWRALGRCLVTWLTCGGLCLGLFVSLWELRTLPSGIDGSPSILNFIHSTFPGNLLPADPTPGHLTDIQVGYSLLLGLLASIGVAATSRRWLLIWVVPTLGLLILTLPVPGITALLWKNLPDAALSISNIWPMQRIMPLLAGLTALAGAMTFDVLAAKSKRWTLIIAATLAGMMLWSGYEAAKYIRRGHATVLPAVLSEFLSRRENSPLLINWLAYHEPLPQVYQPNAYHDAALFNRVWSNDLKTVQVDNMTALIGRAAADPPVKATVQSSAPALWGLKQGFVLEPGRRYLLQLLPGPQTYAGQLLLSSPDFQRTGIMLAPSAPTILMPLWISANATQQVSLNYTPSPDAPPAPLQSGLFEYRLIPYDLETLPVRVHRFAPYEATVSAPAPGWLETHRMFVRGYRATVDGRQVDVRASADARVMVPIPAGNSDVRLDYTGTIGLRISFAVMAGAWLLFGCWRGLVMIRQW